MNEFNFFRKLMRQKRNALTKEFREEASRKLLINVKKLKNIDKYNNIGVYAAFDGEINLIDVINYFWEADKKIFLPKLINSENYKIKKLIFCEFNSDTKLIKNKFDIAEPQDGLCVEVDALDLLLLPLTAFDKQGDRLGMGQGYYDATLQGVKNPPKLVGIGYNFQCVERLVPNPTDVKLDVVITEEDLLENLN